MVSSSSIQSPASRRVPLGPDANRRAHRGLSPRERLVESHKALNLLSFVSAPSAIMSSLLSVISTAAERSRAARRDCLPATLGHEQNLHWVHNGETLLNSVQA